jgi:hypothetical protein
LLLLALQAAVQLRPHRNPSRSDLRLQVGMQNSALGALLASLHFAAHPLAAVPCAISACTHSVMGSLLAAFWRSQPDEDEDTAASGLTEESQHLGRHGGVAFGGAGSSGSAGFGP